MEDKNISMHCLLEALSQNFIFEKQDFSDENWSFSIKINHINFLFKNSSMFNIEAKNIKGTSMACLAIFSPEKHNCTINIIINFIKSFF